MPGRPAARSKKGAETRLRIILAAADLFHRQGVHATSPDEVIAASKTGKGQFYHYFKSKEGLVHEVLQHHLQAMTAGSAGLSYEIDSWQDLERWFAAHLELQQRFGMTRGCPFGTIGNEVTENDELIRQDLNRIFEHMHHRLEVFFIKEQAQGRLDPDASAAGLAHFCIAAVQGAMLMGKLARHSRPVETTIREALAHLEQWRRRQAPPTATAGRGRRAPGP
ncbi:MAG TPA: TetR/AcrR family transcriptional regulator [Thermoanaerobaculia bacterium]|jgi:AcrR family transcriptional regulator|nr:TetR/AcrR family transcriptional regulator [Thermoanaerobaculia bacterium]